ncbi:MAG: helix-turn-helix domain-containing protein [Oscillospiraceae bacterium]|nr:helix-turn-helix domain-containing protein [Oscillospiraceae bacterium]
MSIDIEQELGIFCENVKRLRQREGLSKKEMAKKLGIGVKSLTLIESGIVSKRLGANVLLNILNNFNIYPSDMFSRRI